MKKAYGKTAAGILATLAIFFAPAAAFAQEVPVKDQMLRQIANGIHQDTTALVQKDYVLNKVAKAIAEQAYEKAAAVILKDATTGNNGGPRFIQDFAKFDSDNALAAESHFVSDELDGVCQPFKSDVTNALVDEITNDNYATLSACTLGSTDLEAVDINSPTDWSWNSWRKYIEPQNNPVGSYQLAKQAMDSQVGNRLYYENLVVEQGNGFQPNRTCVAKDPQGNCLKWQIDTPGYVIANNVASAIDRVQFDPLVDSNDVDAILGSLGNQIDKQVYSSGGSLMGLAAGGANSFISDLATDPTGGTGSGGGGGGGTGTTTPGGTGGLPVIKENALAQMNASLKNLTGGDYLTSKTASLDLMNRGIAGVQSIMNCYSDKIAGLPVSTSTDFSSIPVLTPDEVALAQSRIDAASSTINTQLAPVRDTISGDIAAIGTITSYLQGLIDQMVAAKKPADVQAIFGSYQQFLQQNNLGTLTGTDQLAAITAAYKTLQDQVDASMNECRAFPPPPTGYVGGQ